MPRKPTSQRRICFVTGTRAEFGLMASTLATIRRTRGLQLQIVATGMHLSEKHGKSIDQIRTEGYKVDAVVPWDSRAITASQIAAATGRAVTGMAEAFERLETELVLVVGDRVEALAGAVAGSVSGKIVVHVHGGDRALGQIDDSVRHAITKLAHLHFPATLQSAERIRKLGEDRWRIHRVGSPGIDGIVQSALPPKLVVKKYGLVAGSFVLMLVHPIDADETRESRRARMLVKAVRRAGVRRIIAVAPNNDPGSRGIFAGFEKGQVELFRDLPRADFLGLLRDTAMLLGNSSSGIIEAASFGTPVIDVGDRQKGRERGANVRNIPLDVAILSEAIARVWRRGDPVRFAKRNLYASGATGDKIAKVLSETHFDERWRRKLIAY